jgi:hypothetical protein
MRDAEAYKAIKARREAAEKAKMAFRPLLDEAYEFAIPFRRGATVTGPGEERVNRVFDSTAMEAALRFAGKFARDIFPPGFFVIAPGEWIPEGAAKDELRQKVETVSKIVETFFLSGEWEQAKHEMGIDLAAGNAALLVLKGTMAKPVRFVVVPMDEVAYEEGAYNDVTGVFWSRKWTLRAIAAEFPDGRFTAEFARRMAETPEHEAELCQDTIWDGKTGRWRRIVWCPDNRDTIIEQTETRTCPWVTPRYFRVPGERYGRGVLHLAMPMIRTLNVTQKILLQAAAIAMLGIYTAIDDGVFNPDNAPLAPGQIWKVARNGGVLGPSVQRFPDPRIDLQGLQVDRMQMAVRSAMNDKALPPDVGAVRSPTEIIERVKQIAFDDVGAFGRLVHEGVVPLVKRCVEIAFDLGIIPEGIAIDDFILRVEVKSPMAMARQQMRSESVLQYAQIVAMLFPDQPQMVDQLVHRDRVAREAAHALMVPANIVPTEDERRAIAERQAMVAGAAIAAQAAAADPGLMAAGAEDAA